MAKSRGFFAELQHQQQAAQKRQQQAANAAARNHAAAVRAAEQAARQSERARVAFERASAADRKQAERDAKEAHEQEMLMDVAERNALLAHQRDAMASILAATLELDDFVDLESLRQQPVHPPFEHEHLQQPPPPPPPVPVPTSPTYGEEEPPPRALGGLLGGQKRHAERVEQRRIAYEQAVSEWQSAAATAEAQQAQQDADHQQAVNQRRAEYEAARQRYDAECVAREMATQRENAQLDQLIAGMTEGRAEAVEEYISIVLGNSVYPEVFEVEHVFEFDHELAELQLTAWVPPPSAVPDAKEYRYVKAKDEIVPKALTIRERKDLYADAIAQTAIRTLHEVFEADRDGRISTISLIVATETIDSATGLNQEIGFVAVAADRERFAAFDLANVVPSATLGHLNATVSKDPYNLAGIDTSSGVRG